jgi:hypothetical protein
MANVVDGKVMNRLLVYSLAAMVIVAGFIWTPAFAQSEKISLRMLPQPNQIVRMRMVQETDVDISFDGDSSLPAAVMVPVKLATKTVVGITQKSGVANAQGHIAAEITYDEITSEATMNGQPMPANDPSRSFVGKKVTVMFDKEGNVLDIKVPADVGIPEEAFRQMLKSMYGNLPAIRLGVGESTTVPLDFTLPLPIPGAAPLKMDGDVKHTLASIERDTAGRIAKFDHAIIGKMVTDVDMAASNGKVKMSLDFNINGGGAMVRDLDKGLVRTSDTKAAFEGKIKITAESSAPQMPSMNLHGTTRTTTTSRN